MIIAPFTPLSQHVMLFDAKLIYTRLMEMKAALSTVPQDSFCRAPCQQVVEWYAAGEIIRPDLSLSLSLQRAACQRLQR